MLCLPLTSFTSSAIVQLLAAAAAASCEYNGNDDGNDAAAEVTVNFKFETVDDRTASLLPYLSLVYESEVQNNPRG